MSSTQFYKYLDLRGAILTLENQTFKHSKPSDFNDTEDLTTAGIFKEDIDEALKNVSGSFIDIIMDKLDVQPTCGSPMNEQIQALQHRLRVKPELADILRSGISSTPVYNDPTYYRTLSETQVNDINTFMQDYRVLCVTTTNDSEEMWVKYAENHKGIALKIEPNLEKDSKFQLFKPVVYREQRPPLYENVNDFVSGVLFGDLETRCKEMSERIIYSKTCEWESESEYRLVIPIVNEEPWETLPYHSEEITEVYLGYDMEASDIEQIVTLAKNTNPEIAVFMCNRDENKHLFFKPYD